MRKLSCSIAMVALLLLAWLFQQYEHTILISLNNFGFLAPIIFLVLYCLATLLFFPTIVLTLAGGALFGPVLGTIFNLTGAILGATSAFFISRYLADDWFINKNNYGIKKLMLGIERHGWRFVALLRLVPIIPFNLVNYGLGVTPIKFRQYFFATAVFLIPAEIILTYFGFSGMNFLNHKIVLQHPGWKLEQLTQNPQHVTNIKKHNNHL